MKIKALISFAVTANLICAFVFAYADCWFSHETAHLWFLEDIAMDPESRETIIFRPNIVLGVNDKRIDFVINV